MMDHMQLIWKLFVKFFINVGPSLSKKIPPQNSSPDNYIKTKKLYILCILNLLLNLKLQNW